MSRGKGRSRINRSSKITSTDWTVNLNYTFKYARTHGPHSALGRVRHPRLDKVHHIEYAPLIDPLLSGPVEVL